MKTALKFIVCLSAASISVQCCNYCEYHPSTSLIKENSKIQELEAWRAQATKDCINSVMEKESNRLPEKYPEYVACDKAYKTGVPCLPSQIDYWKELRKSYLSGEAIKSPQHATPREIMDIAIKGKLARLEVEKQCSKNPSFYIKHPISE